MAKELNPKELLEDCWLEANFTDKLRRQHKKALETRKKLGEDMPITLKPSFEICLKKSCENIHLCFNLLNTTQILKTSPFISNGICKKLVDFTFRKEKYKPFGGILTKREIARLLASFQFHAIGSRDKELLEKLLEMLSVNSIRYTSQF